jgi:pimeloyl-ACP methyl ester carboxylesterase
MEDRLRHDGFRVLSFNLGGLLYRFNTRPIDTLARMIAEKIENLAARHGFPALHIIGHSKGGLIARRYIQHYGGDKRAKALTTLGTPHHGTPTALVVVGLMGAGIVPSSARDLLPRSRVIAALNRDVFPAQIPLASIHSKEDLICPYWCSVLRPRPGESSMENVLVRGVGHSELAWDPGVYRLVRERLTRAAHLWAERHPERAAPLKPR